MAIPTTGPLSLYATIGVELGVAQSNVSLGTMSNTAGFTEPDAMSEFYGYSSGSAPTVTTYAVQYVSEYQFYVTGLISDNGGLSITEKGFYVGTNSASPTNNTKYSVGGGTYITSWIYSLSPGTTYYVWFFATNSAGTTYGARVQATTIQVFTPIWKNTATIGGSFHYISNFFSDAASVNTYIQSYYLNPYTSSWIADVYEAGNECCDFYPASNNVGQRAATNTRNRIRLQRQSTAATYGQGSFSINPSRYGQTLGVYSGQASSSGPYNSSPSNTFTSTRVAATNNLIPQASGQVFYLEVQYDYA